MILQIFCVHDTKAEVYRTPFFMKTRGEAIRAFKDLANDKNTAIAKHPGDYRLCHIGEFDDEYCTLVYAERITGLGFGSDYLDLPSGAIPLGIVKEG